LCCTALYYAALFCTVPHPTHRTLQSLSHPCLLPLILLLPLLFLQFSSSPYTHPLTPHAHTPHTHTHTHTHSLLHTHAAELGRVASCDRGLWVSIPERGVQGVYIYEQHTLNDVEHLQVSADFCSFIYSSICLFVYLFISILIYKFLFFLIPLFYLFSIPSCCKIILISSSI
jgi:hypothetical protein